MKTFLTALVSALLLAGVYSYPTGCTDENSLVSDCINPFLVANGLDPVDDIDGLNAMISNTDSAMDFHVLTKWTAKTVSHECELMETYASCTRHWMTHCDTTLQSVLKPIMDGVDYQCNADNQPKLVMYGPCLKGDRMTEFMKKTVADYQTNSQRTAMSGDLTQLCLETKNYVNTIGRGTMKICGADAANFQQDIIMKMIEPMLPMISCSFEPKNLKDENSIGNDINKLNFLPGRFNKFNQL